MFVFGSYNTKDYRRNPENSSDICRALLVERVVRELGADAIALQELPGHNPKRAAEGLRQLAEATGMEYMIPGKGSEDDVPAVAIGHDELSVALLWRRGTVEPIPGSRRAYEGEAAGFWHALLLESLRLRDIGWRWPQAMRPREPDANAAPKKQAV